MVPYAEAGPLYGFVLPILISVAVTPTTVWAVAPPGPARANPAATSRARNRFDRLMCASCSGWDGAWFPARIAHVSPGVLPRNAGPGHPDPGDPAEAGDAAGHHVHEHDQEDAEDGPGRGLGDVLGPVRNELDEQGAEDGPGDGGQAADHDAGEQGDGEKDVK